MTSQQPADGGRQDAGRRQQPSLAQTTLRIFELSLGEMLWARRTIFMALIAAVPVLLAVIARVAFADGLAVIRINGVRVGSGGIFGTMIGALYLRFILPALGAFYGTGLIADEVEDKTITYLFTRPIARGSIVLGKYLAYLLCTIAVVLPSVMLAFLFVVPFPDMGAAFGPLLVNLGVLAIGLAAYGSLFLLGGVALKRPLVGGLVFAFGWEPLALVLPGYQRYLTVAYYLQSLAPQAMPAEDTGSLFPAVALAAPSPATSLICLFLLILATLILAMRTVEQREYVLEQ